jgi:branched-chain amino acid transport system permease protein
MSTSIKTYSKGDYINFSVLMVLGFLVIPMTVSSDYWFTSILIPWLCLALATIGQQVIMGYTGQLALGAAGFMAAGAFACFNLVLRVDGLPFFGALIISGLIAAAIGIVFGLPSLRIRGII